jgi:haloalkane dehalogenase
MLSKQEMEVYRSAFPTVESRRPVWRFPNELPIAGEPKDVVALIERAHAALAKSDFAKLLFVGDPGALVTPEFAERFASQLRNCELIRPGAGKHYLQEDHPERIGDAVAGWIAGIEGTQVKAVGTE